MSTMNEVHDVKGLATALKRSPSYVYAMTAAGFEMPGQRATLRMALQWLTNHPDFTKNGVYFCRRGKTGRNGESGSVEGRK
ncbi:MAG TPA: hypothetical protein VG838_00575 [Opitutaceae bacterium]|nr:hypothetical protein [Opitutaceae bacterium]